jgi:hypothetical protein
MEDALADRKGLKKRVKITKQQKEKGHCYKKRRSWVA